MKRNPIEQPKTLNFTGKMEYVPAQRILSLKKTHWECWAYITACPHNPTLYLWVRENCSYSYDISACGVLAMATVTVWDPSAVNPFLASKPLPRYPYHYHTNLKFHTLPLTYNNSHSLGRPSPSFAPISSSPSSSPQPLHTSLDSDPTTDRRRAVRVAWEKLVRWSRSWRSKLNTDVLQRTNKVFFLTLPFLLISLLLFNIWVSLLLFPAWVGFWNSLYCFHSLLNIKPFHYIFLWHITYLIIRL